MKRYAIAIAILTALMAGLMLNGCSAPAAGGAPTGLTGTETEMTEVGMTEVGTAEVGTTEAGPSYGTPEADRLIQVRQGGPYGQISIALPDGWDYEAYPIDSDPLSQGQYGIRFYPKGAENGYIEIAYIDMFGVCGTGLEEETSTIAGDPVHIGTYDSHPYWDFITFDGTMDGIVALTYSVEDWWDAHKDQVHDILETLSFDTAVKEGGAFVYAQDSEAAQIDLAFSLQKITPAGATLVFHRYGADSLEGELRYDERFAIEVLEDDAWTPVPVIVEGDYGFHEVAHIIPADGSLEQELDWEWLYGTLAPGRYRLIKTVTEQRGTGEQREHTVRAQFVLN